MTKKKQEVKTGTLSDLTTPTRVNSINTYVKELEEENKRLKAELEQARMCIMNMQGHLQSYFEELYKKKS